MLRRAIGRGPKEKSEDRVNYEAAPLHFLDEEREDFDAAAEVIRHSTFAPYIAYSSPYYDPESAAHGSPGVNG